MKRYGMLALATVFMISLAVSAQDGPPPMGKRMNKKEMKQGEFPKMNAQKRAALMAIDLNLTDAEKAKVQALFEKQDAQREQHRADVEKIRKEQIEKFQTERKTQDAELEKIIGKEKFQKLEANRHEMKERMMNRHKGGTNDSISQNHRGTHEGKRLQEVR